TSKLGEGTAFTVTLTHCTRDSRPSLLGNLDSGNEFTPQKAKIFAEYIELYQRVSRNESLSAAEQMRLAETKTVVDGYLMQRFKGHDRRIHPRVPLRKPVSVTQQGETRTFEIRDISEGGAMIVVDTPYEIGSNLKLCFLGDRSFEIDAEVVTC